jgi:hypothetical protein
MTFARLEKAEMTVAAPSPDARQNVLQINKGVTEIKLIVVLVALFAFVATQTFAFGQEAKQRTKPEKMEQMVKAEKKEMKDKMEKKGEKVKKEVKEQKD